MLWLAVVAAAAVIVFFLTRRTRDKPLGP